MLLNLLIILIQTIQPSIIYDFQIESSTANWQVVDDRVMGGLSQGKLTVNQDGHGLYEGSISTDNNGGFSSLRYQFLSMTVTETSKITFRIKGDGKKYQFRVKDKQGQYHSYITYFETTGDWQEIAIELKDLYPSFRGRKLNIPNFNHTQIEEIAFLVGNKKAEDFELLIDEIRLD